jgi:hypothetical protein
MRPTEEDQEALELLLDIDRIPEQSARFLESFVEMKTWTVKQCKWFDDLCERYL